MCKYFDIETDVVENLTYDLFKFWLSEDLSMETILREKNLGVRG